jgi:cAMP phosphodiesterase
MRVRVLGCHGGESPRHRSTCFLLDGTVSIDAGSLTSALDLSAQRRLRDVLVSHSHLDHIKDLAGLADNTVGFIRRPIGLWATANTIEVLRRHYFNNILWPDFTRIPTSDDPVFRFRELASGGETEVGPYRVKTIQVNHPVESMALIVRRGRGGALAFSSDTGPTDRLWEAINADGNVRALLLELSFPSRLQALADIAGHLTPTTILTELEKLRAPLPVYLYHMKPPHLPAIERELRGLKNRRLRLLKLGDQIVI